MAALPLPQKKGTSSFKKKPQLFTVFERLYSISSSFVISHHFSALWQRYLIKIYVFCDSNFFLHVKYSRLMFWNFFSYFQADFGLSFRVLVLSERGRSEQSVHLEFCYLTEK